MCGMPYMRCSDYSVNRSIEDATDIERSLDHRTKI